MRGVNVRSQILEHEEWEISGRLRKLFIVTSCDHEQHHQQQQRKGAKKLTRHPLDTLQVSRKQWEKRTKRTPVAARVSRRLKDVMTSSPSYTPHAYCACIMMMNGSKPSIKKRKSDLNW